MRLVHGGFGSAGHFHSRTMCTHDSLPFFPLTFQPRLCLTHVFSSFIYVHYMTKILSCHYLLSSTTSSPAPPLSLSLACSLSLSSLLIFLSLLLESPHPSQ